ncbi:hypothetical protein AAL_07969 [Moelleriella libera RCEF 2490]|uniref:Phospholipase A2 n=1 Tax=Moelleriella libera RCEF 2490 TaxID=1081109 RepID=A0A167WF66_9HYPO|nr:hypothetical protein AAL_07969 [Moelleriella libera RCEF 2490]
MQPFAIAALLGSAVAQAQWTQSQWAGNNGQDTQACARNCNDALNSCRSQAGANQATCDTTYASCLGWQPGAGVTATACASNYNNNGGAYATPTPTAGQTYGSGALDACAKQCRDAYNGCRAVPGVNQNDCRTQFTSCLGYNPTDDYPTACATNGVAPSATPAVAGGSQLSPAYAAMAVGIMALL